MNKPTKEQMLRWIKVIEDCAECSICAADLELEVGLEGLRCWQIKRAIRSLISASPEADNKTLMRLAQDEGISFSVAKIIYDKAWREAEAFFKALAPSPAPTIGHGEVIGPGPLGYPHEQKERREKARISIERLCHVPAAPLPAEVEEAMKEVWDWIGDCQVPKRTLAALATLGAALGDLAALDVLAFSLADYDKGLLNAAILIDRLRAMLRERGK